jgi:hemerythrin-like domain-containing protein
MPRDTDRSGRSNDPLAQLERSHRRLEEACDALTIAAHDRDLETLSNVCAFFSRQVRRHEEDEERSLFPRLTSVDARTIIEQLSREHRIHEALHARLERLITFGHGETARSDADDAPLDTWSELEAIAEEITDAYRVHIEQEEKRLFPIARQLLSTTSLEEIRAEMETRRGR